MVNEFWELGQQNLITFIMINNASIEVPGLGGGFTITISKNGGALVPGTGTKAEIGSGWYSYLTTAAEADTVGTVSMVVTGAGCKQQNLEYVVRQRTLNCIPFTYTVVDPLAQPLENVHCCFSIDAGGVDIVWEGYTDVFGVARDSNGNLPCLDAGTYYVWRNKTGYTFVDPDVEVVS